MGANQDGKTVELYGPFMCTVVALVGDLANFFSLSNTTCSPILLYFPSKTHLALLVYLCPCTANSKREASSGITGEAQKDLLNEGSIHICSPNLFY